MRFFDGELFWKNVQEHKEGSYHTPDEVGLLSYLSDKKYWSDKKRKGAAYLNVPCSFDTEATSFEALFGEDLKKCATMYVWMFGINGHVFLGRKWEELTQFVSELSKLLGLDVERRMLVFVHNNSYDFQFYRKRFPWTDIFVKDDRVPLYALSREGMEFRDSYILTNTKLEDVGNTLTKYKVEKAVGNLDYYKMRHYNTPLTQKEIYYCVHDVLVVMCCVAERIEQEDNTIYKIPLTATGYARRLVRNKCLYPGNLLYNSTGQIVETARSGMSYAKLMRELTLTPKEFILAQKAFAGGHTHANAFYVGSTIKNVRSVDFTSAYIACALCEKYPMTKGRRISPKTITSWSSFRSFLKNYAVLVDIEFFGVQEKFESDHYISISKCSTHKNAVIDNGKVVSADSIRLGITEVDFETIEHVYDIKGFRIFEMYIYEKRYLPRAYREAFWELYKAKTTLKGVEGRGMEYNRSKELLNALYGMMVTNFAGDDFGYYENNWIKTKGNITEAVEEYNKDKRRFSSYLWGIWVTAYNRRNLWTMILECADDFIYGDTDSGKIKNYEKHSQYFEKYNADIIEKYKKACKEMGEVYEVPKTIKGIEKPIGVWDDEGEYECFKTLGAKRYMYVKDGKLSLTISGVNKEKAIPYLLDEYKTNEGVLDAFCEGFTVPPFWEHDGKILEASGKTMCAYNDEPFTCMLEDYLGNIAEIHEESSAWLMPGTYTLGIAEEYNEFLRMFRNNTMVSPVKLS